MEMVPGRAPRANRLHDRPVVEAGSVPGYGAVFNAGLLYHEGTYHLFARGVRDGYRRNDGSGPRFLDYISDVLVLTSTDGRSYEFGYVLARAGTSGVHCFEDPRVQRVQGVDGEHIVMTYTSLPPHESGRPWRIGSEVYQDRDILPRELISQKLSSPNVERIFFIRHALRAGFGMEEIFQLTRIDRWFLAQIKEIVDFEEELAGSVK